MSLVSTIEAALQSADPDIVAQIEAGEAVVTKVGSSLLVTELASILPGPLSLLASLAAPIFNYLAGLGEAELNKVVEAAFPNATPAAKAAMVAKIQAAAVVTSAKLVTPGSGIAGVVEASQTDLPPPVTTTGPSAVVQPTKATTPFKT